MGSRRFSAPARQGDIDLTCRTLEIVGAEGATGAGSGVEGLVDTDLAHHDGVLASCGGFGFLGGGVADPALQVLGDQDYSAEPTSLVAFVVSERFRGAPLRIVFEGADPVELPLDANGLAVWDGSLTTTIEAVELDGGAVRCPVRSPFGGEELDEGYEDDPEYEEYVPTAAVQLSGGASACVRA